MRWSWLRSKRQEGLGSGNPARFPPRVFVFRIRFILVEFRSGGLAYSKREDGWADFCPAYAMEVLRRVSFLAPVKVLHPIALASDCFARTRRGWFCGSGFGARRTFGDSQIVIPEPHRQPAIEAFFDAHLAAPQTSANVGALDLIQLAFEANGVIVCHPPGLDMAETGCE